MALRSLRKTHILRNSVRYFSKDTNLVCVTVNDKTGVATLEMQRRPVNSLSLELLTQMSSALTELEKNKARGLILTSKNDGVFSAGLDIMELYKSEKDRMIEFWTVVQDTWIKLYNCPYPSVAVINGHAPAGGCALALSCEYRVMFKNCTIGLNETKLGIVAPRFYYESMKNVIGHRQTEKALATGHMFSTDEALAMELIDEVIENKADGFAKAETYIAKFAKLSSFATSLTKNLVRKEAIDTLAKNRQGDLDNFLNVVTLPSVQETLGCYLQAMKKKSGKA